jgi:hypothetical protein
VRTTSGWTLGSAAALLALVLATGCGGGDNGDNGESELLATSDVIAIGDRICNETQESFEDVQVILARTPRQAVDITDQLIEAIDEQIAGLTRLALGAQSIIKEDLERYVAALRVSREHIQEAKDAAQRGNRSDYEEAARDYRQGRAHVEQLAGWGGFNECGLPHHGGGRPGGCEPGYSKCLDRSAIDYDCRKKGDGPKYVHSPIQVTGSDPFDLDSNRDGIGCETGWQRP